MLEAKHKVFMKTLKKFKNITESHAEKHQTSTAYHWETSAFNHVESGPLKSLTVDSEDSDMFARAAHAAVPKDLFSANWVKMSGTESRTGLIIGSHIDHEMPVFCRIKRLLVDSAMYFLVNKLVVDHFSEHFHAYQVFESDERCYQSRQSGSLSAL